MTWVSLHKHMTQVLAIIKKLYKIKPQFSTCIGVLFTGNTIEYMQNVNICKMKFLVFILLIVFHIRLIIPKPQSKTG